MWTLILFHTSSTCFLMNKTLKTAIVALPAFLLTVQLLAQSAGFSISGGANYSLLQSPDAQVLIPFSQFVNGKFKTYDALSESAFEFRPGPGAFLSGGVQWNISRSLLIGTGLTLQYSSYDLRPDFLRYLPAPGGSDTLFLPPTTISPTCDEIVIPDDFDPATDPFYRHDVLHLQIPIELRLRPGKGQLEIAAGAWAALPALTRIAKEDVFINRRYFNNAAGVAVSECVYSKGTSVENSGDGFNNLIFGVRGELAYRFTPSVGMFAGYSLSLSNLYDKDTKPALLHSNIDGIQARQQTISLGLRYQWEPAREEVAADANSRLNRATHEQLFKKKSKSSYKKYGRKPVKKKRR